jgi:hypothetical protein
VEVSQDHHATRVAIDQFTKFTSCQDFGAPMTPARACILMPKYLEDLLCKVSYAPICYPEVLRTLPTLKYFSSWTSYPSLC